MRILKPACIREGDTVAVVSPSWGGPSLYPHVFDLGLRNIETLFGVCVKEFPTARMDAEKLYRDPKVRAKDINDAFADPGVKAIFASIGGDDSVRILPFLDLESILKNPKILMGFSDTATLTTYLNSHGMVTYNGPSVLAGFAQLKHLPSECAHHLKTALMDPAAMLELKPYPYWANNYSPWSAPDYSGETLQMLPNDEGWHWLQGSGAVTGSLFGGCIEVLEFLKGTEFWPKPGFFKNRVLFFETSEEKPTVSQVKYMLRNYGSMGVLNEVSGILFGRARSYSESEKAELDGMLVQISAGEFGRADMPIVSNLDFGHTEPQFVMPLGIEIRIDCEENSISFTESFTSP